MTEELSNSLETSAIPRERLEEEQEVRVGREGEGGREGGEGRGGDSRERSVGPRGGGRDGGTEGGREGGREGQEGGGREGLCGPKQYVH